MVLSIIAPLLTRRGALLGVGIVLLVSIAVNTTYTDMYRRRLSQALKEVETMKAGLTAMRAGHEGVGAGRDGGGASSNTGISSTTNSNITEPSNANVPPVVKESPAETDPIAENKEEGQPPETVPEQTVESGSEESNGAESSEPASEAEAPASSSDISEFRERFLLWDLVNNYPFNDEATQRGDNYFMYECGGYCGGWADQLKGTFLAYLVANLTGRHFKARYLKPGHILDYLVPNRVNWSIPNDKWRPKHEEVHYHNALGDGRFKLVANVTNFTAKFHLDDGKPYHVGMWNLNYVTGIMDSEVYANEVSWMKNLTPADMIGEIYKRLFKLHPRLQKVLEKVLYDALPTPKHRLVCMHIRLGHEAFGSDWARRNSVDNLPMIWSWLSNMTQSPTDNIFLMSDSKTVVSSAYNQSFAHKLITLPGAIIHNNKFSWKNMTEVFEGIEKLTLEHHMVMNCDVFVRGISGLSVIASAVRGTDKGLYCLWEDGRITKCSRNDFSRFY